MERWNLHLYFAPTRLHSNRSIIEAINNKGQIVGNDDKNTGFLLSGGEYITIRFPGATATYVTGISNGNYTPLSLPQTHSARGLGINNDGQILAFYHTADSTGCFVLSGQSSTVFGLVDAVPDSCRAINDHGQVVGAHTRGDLSQSSGQQAFGFLTTAPGVPIRIGIFSHIAAGGEWDTAITLINTSTISVQTTLKFFADGGGK